MPKDSTGGLLLLPAVLILLIFAFRLGRRGKGRSGGGDSQWTAAVDGASRRHDLQRAMEELQVNLMEFSRDVEGRLDTRIAALEKLLREADERIKRLEELSGPSPSGGEPAPLHREIYQLADQGFDKVEIARRASLQPGEVELILGLRKARDV